MSNPLCWAGLALLIGGLWACGAMGAPPDYEVELAPAEHQKLSPGETRTLNGADKVFSDGKFAQAAVEYDVFLKEFPHSAVAPYALLRKGRAAQKADDAGQALKMFDEVMDLYSDKIEYAVPALYFSGQCHWGLRGQDEAVKAWKEVAEDKDYRKHPAAPYALGSLAWAMRELGRPADATKYYYQEALDFPQTREPVIEALLHMHVIGTPNIEAVREAVRTLDGLEAKPQKGLATDETYFWARLLKAVRYGKDMLNTWRAEQTKIQSYCRYWANAMEGKLPGDDETQLWLTEYHRIAGIDSGAWSARMDKQFAALQKPGDYDRIVRWILIFSGQPQKAEECYAKLDFGKMTNSSIVNLMLGSMGPLPDMAKRACTNVRFDEMDDEAKASLLVKVAAARTGVSEDIAMLILARMKDPDRGRMAMLNYWATVDYTRAEVKAENGLPWAEPCVTNPAYAKEANGLKAGLLRGVGRYEEAIQAYQANNEPPKNLFAIADCYIALKQPDKAVEQWREIAAKYNQPQNLLAVADGYVAIKQFDKAVEQWREVAAKYAQRAPEVAMKIAYAYRDAGQADKYEAELRELARKYLPDTGVGQAARAELKALNKPVEK